MSIATQKQVSPLGTLSLFGEDGASQILLSQEEQKYWAKALTRITTIAVTSHPGSKRPYQPTRQGLYMLVKRGGETPIAFREQGWLQTNVDGFEDMITLYTFYRSKFPCQKQ